MSTPTKVLWILAGGNGSGKSTFFQNFLKGSGIEFINADLIEKKLQIAPSDKSSYEAATIARKKYRDNLTHGRSFCFETVFSHESKLEMLMEAKDRGYYVNLVFIHLRNPDLNKLRVDQRVETGGHAVPAEKIVTRIPRTLALMQDALVQTDCGMLYDNSGSGNDAFRRIAVKKDSTITLYVEQLPQWAADALVKCLPQSPQ